MSLPAGSKPTITKPLRVFTAGLPKGKGLPWLTFGSSIKSSDSGISIYKKTSVAITVFSRTGLNMPQAREHAKRQRKKKPRDHMALLLSFTIKIWPSIAGKGVFSDWPEWDGSYPKVSSDLSCQTCLEAILISWTLSVESHISHIGISQRTTM